jgi:hypothetical protein
MFITDAVPAPEARLPRSGAVLQHGGPALPRGQSMLPRNGPVLPHAESVLPRKGPELQGRPDCSNAVSSTLPRDREVLSHGRFLLTSEDAAAVGTSLPLIRKEQRQTSVSNNQPQGEVQLHLQPTSPRDFAQNNDTPGRMSAALRHQVNSRTTKADRQHFGHESQLHQRFSSSDIRENLKLTSRSAGLTGDNFQAQHKSFNQLWSASQFQDEVEDGKIRPGLIRKRLILEPNEDPETINLITDKSDDKSPFQKIDVMNSPWSLSYPETAEFGREGNSANIFSDIQEENHDKFLRVANVPSVLNSLQHHNNNLNNVREFEAVFHDSVLKTDVDGTASPPVSVAADWKLRAPDVTAEISLWNSGDQEKNATAHSVRTAPVRGQEEDFPAITVKPRGPVKGFFNRDRLQQFPFFSK